MHWYKLEEAEYFISNKKETEKNIPSALTLFWDLLNQDHAIFLGWNWNETPEECFTANKTVML